MIRLLHYKFVNEHITQVSNIPRSAGIQARNISYEQVVKPGRQEIANNVSSIFFAPVTHAVHELTENVQKRIQKEYPNNNDSLKNIPWGKVTGREREKKRSRS